MGLSELSKFDHSSSLLPTIIFYIFQRAKSLAEFAIRFVKLFLCFLAALYILIHKIVCSCSGWTMDLWCIMGFLW